MSHGTPNVWDRAIAISTALGTVGVFLAILVSILLTTTQIREERDEAKAQHLVEEVARFDEPPLLTTRQTLAAKRIDSKNETLRSMSYDDAPPELWDVLNACDHVGLLTRKRYLDVSDVWNEMGYWLHDIYADAEPVIEADRTGDPATGRRGDPASMTNCTWLIEQMRPIEAKLDSGAQLHPTTDELYGFYGGELDAKAGDLTTRKVMK